MRTMACVISCLSLVAGALVALDAEAARPVQYVWTGTSYVVKDTGMAQYPVLGTMRDSAGNFVLYSGSENFSTGPGKLQVYQQLPSMMASTFTTPANDESIDALSYLVFLVTGGYPEIGVVTDAAHVYLFDGANFTNITPTAAAFSSNLGVYSIAQYGQKLFIGTGGSAGSAQVWAYDGTTWTQQSLPGFPSNNYYAWVMTVFNNALYVGTVDYAQAAQVWKYDGNSWSMVSIPGFSSSNYAIASMAVYNGALYIGTSNTLGNGAEIWRYDGSAWTKLSGFGRNGAATAMTVFNNTLLIGTTNYAQGAAGQLWAYDGTAFTLVTAPSAFGSNGNSGIVSLASTGDTLYAGTYNNTGAEIWTVTASGSSGSGANSPGALSGLWWNPNESGWGVSFTQRGPTVFVAWYTYDSNGNPKWYVASDCAGMTGTSGTCTGSLYQVNGPTFFGVPFTPITSSQVSVAGTFSTTFSDANNASMTYTVNGQGRTVPIVRQVFQTGTTAPAVDYTDLWWNPNESGWGVSITQQYGVMFLAWYVYSASGNPVWYVAPDCVVVGSGCTGAVYSTIGPPLGPTFNPGAVMASSVGTITASFSDANNGTISYTVNGVSGTKQITRQLF